MGFTLEVRANGTRYWLFRYLWQGASKMKMFHPAAFQNTTAAEGPPMGTATSSAPLAGGVEPPQSRP